MNFTNEEIYFIEQCIYMASREGFYLLERGFDTESVGRSILKKLNFDEKTIEECMRGY